MTYRERLKDSMDLWEDDFGNEQFSFPFVYFIMRMGAVLVSVADFMAEKNFGKLSMDGEIIDDGSPIESPDALYFVQTLSGKSLGRGTALFQQTYQFIKWLLDQDADNKDLDNYWANFEVLADKWNEFANICKRAGD